MVLWGKRYYYYHHLYHCFFMCPLARWLKKVIIIVIRQGHYILTEKVTFQICVSFCIYTCVHWYAFSCVLLFPLYYFLNLNSTFQWIFKYFNEIFSDIGNICCFLNSKNIFSSFIWIELLMLIEIKYLCCSYFIWIQS